MLMPFGISKQIAGYSGTILRIAVAIMAALAVLKLGDELLRLVWRSGYTAAIDLKYRHAEVNTWFAGIPVYRRFPNTAAYPPATYPLLWPLLGWLPLEPARAFWAAISGAALAWTAYIFQRESSATSRLGRAFVVLMLLGINQTGVALGNGQLILVVLPPLLIGVLIIQRGRGTWKEDLLAASCLTFALLKITITVPFLWLALLLPVVSLDGEEKSKGWRLRPAVLIATAYAALTLFAAHFQPQGLTELFVEWLAVAAVAGTGGYSEVHSWLDLLGQPHLKMPASAVLFLALGVWTYRYRSVDLWLRLGVAALVARFWAYHRLYDDVLVVVALVALFRVAQTRTIEDHEQHGDTRFAAWMLLGVTVFLMLIPARLHTMPAPWNMFFNASHALSWLVVLAFLGRAAERERRRE